MEFGIARNDGTEGNAPKQMGTFDVAALRGLGKWPHGSPGRVALLPHEGRSAIQGLTVR
jgi:hypothetical protein